MRELAPSPRDVPTYDHKPEMSAHEATEAFVRHWGEQDFAFAIINFANPDMVGHTGVIAAAVKAVETVDGCLGQIVEAVHATGGACIVTADHGNADEMLEQDGSPDTAHSLNPVPFIVTAGADALDGEGILADVAPTALALLGIEQPEQMTGRSLLALTEGNSIARTAEYGRIAVAPCDVATQAAEELDAVELGAWRGCCVSTRARRELDAELEAAHALPLTSYDVLIYLRRRPGGGCAWPSWPTACCSAAPA